MAGITGKISKTLIPGSVLTCADNSGAKTIMIINRLGKSGRRGGLRHAGIGDIVIASVKTGTPAYRKKKVRAIIIRQKHPLRRLNGLHVRFEDNAAILITETGLPIGTEVKGAVAREVIEKNIKLASVASRVV